MRKTRSGSEATPAALRRRRSGPLRRAAAALACFRHALRGAGWAAGFAFAAFPLAAQDSRSATPGPSRFDLVPAVSRLWFEAHSTLGGFSGEAHGANGWAWLGPDGRFIGGKGRVEVLVRDIRTGIGLRDHHLRETLDADRFPFVTLVVDSVAPHPPQASPHGAAASDTATVPPLPGGEPVLLHARLTIRDRTRTVEVPAAARLAGDTLRVVGAIPVRFTEFGMKPPTRLLVTHVGDAFALFFDARFAPAGH